jgi:hypothetical protein
VIEVTSIKIRSLDLDHLDVFWEIGPVAAPRAEGEPHEILNYDFYVLRAGDGQGGPWEQVGGPFRDTYHFRDIAVSLLHKWRTYFYKVRVVHRPTGEEAEFGPVGSQVPEPDLIAAEAIRQEDVLFREFIGRRAWLFPKRTFGPRCTCFDATLGRRTRSGHRDCFDTGFFGGYMAPIEVFVQIDPYPKRTESTQLMEMQQVDAMGRMICFPLVHPKDILVEAENLRWRVLGVTPTQRLRFPVRQELQLHEIPKGDIEYELPLNVDLSRTELAARRNFSNPTCLQNDDDVSDILSFYGRGHRAGR